MADTRESSVPQPATPVRYRGLSEDAIKKAFIPFLRSFYKYRYEFKPETIETSLDNVSQSGIVADGMLRFQKSDGTVFTCTYEASSLDKAGEVKYALNTVYFIWDCLAFGAVTSAVTYAWFYYARLPWLAELQWTGNAGLLMGTGVIGFLLWYFLMQRWKKYRYIYAIEQFRRYFADEQWIALGEDVFPAPTDPYLLELKKQCVYQGYGLAIVASDGSVRPLTTPSRLGVFGKDRRMVEWLTRNEWYQAMSQNIAAVKHTRPQIEVPDEYKVLWNKFWRPVQYLLVDPFRKKIWSALSQPLQNTNNAFERYMTGQSVQKWVFAIGLLAIGLIGYQVSQYTDTYYIDPDELLRRDRLPNPEDEPGYLYEGDPPPAKPGGIKKQRPEPRKKPAEEEEIQIINLSGDDE